MDSYRKKLNFAGNNFLTNIEELDKDNFHVACNAFVTLILNIIDILYMLPLDVYPQKKIKQQTCIPKQMYELIRPKGKCINFSTLGVMKL